MQSIQVASKKDLEDFFLWSCTPELFDILFSSWLYRWHSLDLFSDFPIMPLNLMRPSEKNACLLGNTEQIEKYLDFFKEGFSVSSFEL